MPILLILFFIMMIFPYLIIPIIIFLGIGFLFLLPYVFVFNSFYNVITFPWQIMKITFDKRVRKNHSLEHATINVLEERFGRSLRAGGLANENGFSLSGPDLPPPHEVLSAVKEGHFRMMNGEKELAVHPRCGTSIAAANFLFSLVFLIALFSSHHFTLINIIIAFFAANFLAKPFGKVLQKHLTTHTIVDDVAIQDIYIQTQRHGFFPAFLLNLNRSYFIRTYQAK